MTKVNFKNLQVWRKSNKAKKLTIPSFICSRILCYDVWINDYKEQEEFSVCVNTAEAQIRFDFILQEQLSR